jgi:hypothetical protein
MVMSLIEINKTTFRIKMYSKNINIAVSIAENQFIECAHSVCKDTSIKKGTSFRQKNFLWKCFYKEISKKNTAYKMHELEEYSKNFYEKTIFLSLSRIMIYILRKSIKKLTITIFWKRYYITFNTYLNQKIA